MGENKKYYWLKLKEDFFRDKEIKKLRKIAGGDTYTIIYLKLQLLSLKREGKLIFENLEDSFAEEMALELDESTENVKMTLLYLQKCGLIEEVADNEYMLPQTMKSIGTETQGAERMRRCRENKQVSQCDGQALLSDTTVTNSDTEIEIELEKEIKKDIDIKEKKSKKSKDTPTKVNYAERVTLSVEEYDKLISQYNKEIADNKIIDLDLWKGSKGKTTCSDYLTILSWLRKENPVINKIQTPKTKAPARRDDF